jgi:multidrug efflux system membrane fusion protein
MAFSCVLLFLSGCQREKPAPQAPPAPTVTITQPVMTPVQAYLEYNGNLEAIETVQIIARVKGILMEVLFTEGDEVKKDAPLYKIDPREYIAAVKRAEADKQKAATEVKRAKKEEDRVKKLKETGAVSDEEYEQRVAARETADAVLNQTDAALDTSNIQKGYTEIKAPISGQISRTMVTRGNLVGQNENTLLTSIVNMEELHVYFDVPERDLVDFQRARQAGQTADVLSQSLKVEIGVATEKDYPHAGVIDFRENRVDSGTGTVRIRGKLKNPKMPPGNTRLLYPGLFARVRIPNGQPQNLPAIPEDALMTGQEGRYVYVLDEKNVVQKRTVTVGAPVWKGVKPEKEAEKHIWTLKPVAPAAGKEPDTKATATFVPSVVSIISGLEPKDKVIINGLTKARPGLPVAPELRELQAPLVAK